MALLRLYREDEWESKRGCDAAGIPVKEDERESEVELEIDFPERLGSRSLRSWEAKTFKSILWSDAGQVAQAHCEYEGHPPSFSQEFERSISCRLAFFAFQQLDNYALSHRMKAMGSSSEWRRPHSYPCLCKWCPLLVHKASTWCYSSSPHRQIYSAVFTMMVTRQASARRSRSSIFHWNKPVAGE